MASQFKIEKSVPAPPGGRGRQCTYPWKEMGPGDSFVVPCSNPKRSQSALGNCARMQFGKGNYATAVEGNAVRVWRLK